MATSSMVHVALDAAALLADKRHQRRGDRLPRTMYLLDKSLIASESAKKTSHVIDDEGYERYARHGGRSPR
ncbi:MAG: hypothetical protein U0521_04495 [Anaerolineae bacterium]